MTSLNNQTALVTGGSSGIGAAIALALAREGANIAITGRRLAPLEATLAQIEAAGGRGLAIQADVSIAADVQRMVDTTLQRFGALHIVVNNAGVGGGDHIHQQNIEDWDRVMAVNLRGPFLVARAALPLMRAQKQGHIIAISSGSGVDYFVGNGAYGVSKHALNALHEFIRRENEDFGIKVDTICPGFVDTPMVADYPDLNLEKCLTVEDVADLALWLLTRPARVNLGAPIRIRPMENPKKTP